MVKIGLCGTSCSGKTTLAQQLSEYYGWKLITEIARGFRKEMLKFEETQYQIIFTQIQAELFSNENIISDRTVIDNFMYITQNRKPRKYLLNLILTWAQTYDIIFFCKKLPFIEDGFRINYDIENKLLTFLKCNLIDYEILEGNKKERFEKAVKIINKEINK